MKHHPQVGFFHLVFLAVMISVAVPKSAYGQLLPKEPTVPWLLIKASADQSNGKLRVTGERLHLSEKKVAYPKLVPLKETQEFGVEIRHAETLIARPKQFESIDPQALFPSGEPCSKDRLVGFIDKNKFVFVFHSYQELDQSFLDSLKEDVPIIRLIEPDVSEFQLKFPAKDFGH